LPEVLSENPRADSTSGGQTRRRGGPLTVLIVTDDRVQKPPSPRNRGAGGDVGRPGPETGAKTILTGEGTPSPGWRQQNGANSAPAGFYPAGGSIGRNWREKVTPFWGFERDLASRADSVRRFRLNRRVRATTSGARSGRYVGTVRRRRLAWTSLRPSGMTPLTQVLPQEREDPVVGLGHHRELDPA
jgi:hypothetical protein